MRETDMHAVPTRSEDYALHPFIARRRSTRAFSERPVEKEKLRSVLEAARWAPSSNNVQPWRFVVATHDYPDDHRLMVSLLAEKNREWAENAPVLLLAAAETINASTRQKNKFAFHDLALATANLTFQATALGLAVHHMGGFDAEKARATYAIPAGYEPAVVVALGYQGTAGALSENLQQRETAPRLRKSLSETVYEHTWGNAAPLVSEKNKDSEPLCNQSTNN